MKKLMILSATFLFSIPLVFGQVVEKEKELVKEIKEEIKEEKQDVKEEKKDVQIRQEQLQKVKNQIKHLEGDEVSYQAEQSFLADFEDVSDVKWERVDPYDVAEFTKDGKEMKAYYDFDADLIGTTHYVTFEDLPQSGQEEIKEEYKDYEIGPVVFFHNNEANSGLARLYGIEFEKADNYFVELTKGSEKIILQVLDNGQVFFFKELD